MLIVSLLPAIGRRRALAASLAVLTLPFLHLAPTGAIDRPDEAKKVFCPVLGLPECKSCEHCPSGYCSLRPDKSNALAFEGGQLQFCCGKCKANFAKAPAKFTANAHHQLVATGQARQVKCPLCGKERGFVVPVTVGGVTVGFSSDECADAARKATPAERMEMLFGAQAFVRGFTVVAGKK
jgi:hypothetical protein